MYCNNFNITIIQKLVRKINNPTQNIDLENEMSEIRYTNLSA